MENLKSTEPINLESRYGWCSDIYQGEKSSFETDICTVWGSTEEELNHRVTMIKKAPEMLEALKEVDKLLEDYFQMTGHNERENAIAGKVNSLINEIES